MSDSELDTAKEEAVVDETADLEEVVDEVEEEEVEEIVEEELPADNAERSNLGRKVSALFKKNDKMESVIAQQAQIIEKLMPQEYNEEDDLPVTRKELSQLISKQDEEANKYETDFKKTFHKLCEVNDLSEEDSEMVGEILLQKYNKKISGDGKLDGATNFQKALFEFAKPKKTPLKKGKASGVITKQKSEVRGKKPVKLDAVSEKYLKMIERLDGSEKADRLRKSI